MNDILFRLSSRVGQRLLSLLVALALCAPLSAQTKAKWIKNVRKAQAMAYAYNDKGEMTGQSNVVFIGNDGQIVTQYDFLRNAASVKLVAANGKQYNVTSVDAANSLFNLARLNTDCDKPSGLKAVQSEMPVGTAVLIVPAPGKGGILCKDASVSEASQQTTAQIEHSYYTINGNGADETLNHVFAPGEDCLPVMTAGGELLGLLQLVPESQQSEKAYAVSAILATRMATNGMSAISGDYTALTLPTRIPADEEQARTFLFLHPKANAAKYENIVRQYIQSYPSKPYGYLTLAEWHASLGNGDKAEQAYKEALDAIKSDGRDEILFSISRYQYASALAGDSLQLPKAYDNIEAAYRINPVPAYRLHQASLLYAMRRYGEACDCYQSLAGTALRSADIFTKAAQCASMLEADSANTALRICLLDSAINCYARPLPVEAATAVWMRAQAKNDAGRYREAVHDYNEFEHLLSGRVNASFYYIRSQCELSGRLFQQALDDATRATLAEPDNVEYLVHNANIYLRLGMADDARPLLQRAAGLGEAAAREWLDKNPGD